MEQNIEEIYKEHLKTVYNYLFCLCHDESLSEELAQETFCIATKKINGFRNECKIQVWLCQIAKHLWFKELKRRRKAVVVSMDSEIGEIKSDFDIEEDFIESEQREELYRSMEDLDGPSKELVYLRLTTELTFKEIAQLLGKSEAWARVTYYRWKEEIAKTNRREEG